MKGSLNGIWFTNDGDLHSNIPNNMAKWVSSVKDSGFEVVLWTNTQKLRQSEVQKLVERNIIVRNYSEKSESELYSSFIYFLTLGEKDDKSAFALASDIFRMIILSETPDSEVFIYADPNDILFSDLGNDLQKLEQTTANSIFGFHFPISIGRGVNGEDIALPRNDVLIAIKLKNQKFFQRYLAAYSDHIQIHAKTYKTPQDASQAQAYAEKISNSTNSEFFDYIPYETMTAAVRARFLSPDAEYELHTIMNSASILTHIRVSEFSNTWLPQLGLPRLLQSEEIRVARADYQLVQQELKQLKKTKGNMPFFWYSEKVEEEKISCGKYPPKKVEGLPPNVLKFHESLALYIAYFGGAQLNPDIRQESVENVTLVFETLREIYEAPTKSPFRDDFRDAKWRAVTEAKKMYIDGTRTSCHCA